MKKLAKLFILLSLVMVCSISFVIFAETREGDELITNGDFDFQAGELAFPDPVFGAEYGNAAGWGTLAWDSAALAIEDPDDATNTVLKLSLYDDAKAWSSFFRFMTINGSTTYDISIDFKIVGSTDNIGFRFAGAPALEIVFLDHASKTAIADKTDWYNVEFQFDTAAGSYDSIALWFNTLGSVDNYALLDNISVKEAGTDIELNVGGDFEGFLDYAPGLDLTETVNSYGFFGTNAQVGGGFGTINTGGYIAKEVVLATADYRTAFDFTIADVTNGTASIEYYNASDAVVASEVIMTAGVIDSSNVTLVGSDYSYNSDTPLTETCSYVKINYTGDSSLVIDNLSIKELQEIPDNPFDPSTTYYEVSQLLVNGDFEAFDAGQVFSEEQLEGAWGSISLDGPAMISSVNDSKVMDLGKTAGKMYTSAFVITPPELMVNDLLRLRYDYKLDLESDLSTIVVANSGFVGASNEDYYTVDLKTILDGNDTVGNELLNMPVSVTDNGDGWFTVEMDFQVSTEFLIKCNSIRFLFTPTSDNDHLYIDNVELIVLDDEEPTNLATALEITEADQEITEGEEVTLNATVTPADADNNSLTWASSDEAIATIDASGKVTAVAKGAVTITCSLDDDSLTDTIIVTVLEAPSGFGIGAIIASCVVGFAAIVGVVIFIKRR
ncbi:MAG: Ig-like domain-containing protein [Tenericutes bacterium]|nr:Ig-like domain-containing protein [Mycoplasmatota bacterium]